MLENWNKPQRPEETELEETIKGSKGKTCQAADENQGARAAGSGAL